MCRPSFLPSRSLFCSFSCSIPTYLMWCNHSSLPWSIFVCFWEKLYSPLRIGDKSHVSNNTSCTQHATTPKNVSRGESDLNVMFIHFVTTQLFTNLLDAKSRRPNEMFHIRTTDQTETYINAHMHMNTHNSSFPFDASRKWSWLCLHCLFVYLISTFEKNKRE